MAGEGYKWLGSRPKGFIGLDTVSLMSFSPSPPAEGPPPPATRSRKGLVIGVGIGAAVLLLLLVVVLASVASRVSGGTPLSDLHRGECFNTSKALVAEKALRVDCDEPHTDEVAGVLSLPSGVNASYPRQEGILDFGRRDCLQPVSEYYAGKPQAATTQMFVFGPNEAACKNGERAVVCSLREATAVKRSGSYLGP